MSDAFRPLHCSVISWTTARAETVTNHSERTQQDLLQTFSPGTDLVRRTGTTVPWTSYYRIALGWI